MYFAKRTCRGVVQLLRAAVEEVLAFEEHLARS